MAIEIRNASLMLGNNKVLDDISTRFNFGELTIILGPNGTGKSSLLKVLSQEWQCTGELFFYGKAAASWQPRELAKSVGVLPQSSSLSFGFTAREVVALGGLTLSIAHAQLTDICNQNMALTDVLHLSERLYPTLSGGEKQGVHLARVLTQLAAAPRNPILMLDEPTSALDIAHQHKTLQLAKDKAKAGAAVIAIIHDLNLAAKYADRIIMLSQGKIKAVGAPAKVLQPQLIADVYGWNVNVMPHPENDYCVILP